MRLWKIAGIFALSAFSGTSSAQRVCIANVCSNSGSLPSGAYHYSRDAFGKESFSYPNGLPADAYIKDPRTGAHRPLRQETTETPHVPLPYNQYPYNQYPYNQYNQQPEMATPADTTQKAPERKFIVFPVPGSEQQIVCSTDVLDSNKERNLGAFCAMVYSQFRGAVEKNPYKHTFSLTDGTTAYCKKDFRTGAYVQPTRGVIPTGEKPVCLSFN